MPSGIITLTTDFGLGGPYVAAMKGVILGINPAAKLVDICHEVRPQNKREAALYLSQVVDYYPSGTVHLVVIDPDVGTRRRVVCVEAEEQLFVAPDNGVLCWAVRARGRAQWYELTERRFWRQPVSATFHGRDIMGPAAAHLSLGRTPSELGRPTDHWVPMPWPEPVRSPEGITGEVLACDRFGNLISNLTREEIVEYGGPEGPVVQCAGREAGPVRRTYADVPDGQLVALFGSSGFLEIAVRNGSAADRLGAGPGAAVVVRSRREPSG